jgi:endonuclease YncB( thermonuclease family)/integrase
MLGRLAILTFSRRTGSPTGPAKVIDGDTIVVAGQLVRLHGIDAPELDQTFWWRGQKLVCGTMALAALEALTAGMKVRCKPVERDRHGRLVAKVFSPKGVDIGRRLVSAGWALAYRRYSTDYVDAEDEARKAKRGRRCWTKPTPWSERPATPGTVRSTRCRAGRSDASPHPRASARWLRVHELPRPLQQELDEYLHRLGHPDPFVGPGSRILRPGTVIQYRHMLIMLASALARSGVPVEELTSIAVLVRPQNVERALKYLYDRAGSRVSASVHLIAFHARHIAAHVGLPDQDRARLDEILAWVNRAAPPKRGLAEKNRKLLEHMDDPGFVHRLLTLPSRLTAAARQMTASGPAMSMARDAVAAELLLTCSMRIGNLRLGETIRKFGEGAEASWVIDVPGDKVKNGEPLRYPLSDQAKPLLEEYLANWHHRWCGHGVAWLFPDQHGGHVEGKVLSASIAKRARRYVGVRITAHQFRHLAAELYLREDPNGIAIVSQHLGHRDLNTTRRFYAREQTRIATQRYHEVRTKQRAVVPRRKTRKPRGKAT